MLFMTNCISEIGLYVKFLQVLYVVVGYMSLYMGVETRLAEWEKITTRKKSA